MPPSATRPKVGLVGGQRVTAEDSDLRSAPDTVTFRLLRLWRTPEVKVSLPRSKKLSLGFYLA